ncbi:MAG: InlB B-repeat-containing protein [Lachnospiraceae bacterium]
MKKTRIYAVSLVLFAGILSCGNILPAAALPVYQNKEMNVATDSNAEYEKPEEVMAEPALMRQSRASDVLTITGSGVEEKMAGTLGKPGVYLLFQGAEYRHGFDEMISNHTTEGTSRQIDGIWEYYKKNETKTVSNLKTEIWKGSGSYSNTELVKVADAITIQNSTDTDTGKWNTVVTIKNPHPKLTGVLFYYYAPHLADYGGVTIFPFGGQQAVAGAEQAHTHVGTSRTEPTCTTEGAITGSCEMCGSIHQTIPALGHIIPGIYDTTAVAGYKIKNCGRCGVRLETVPNQYQVSYVGNGATGGGTEGSRQQVGTQFSVAENGFSRTGYQFTLWNTQAAGTGTGYQPGQSVQNLTLTDQATVQLFAQWKANQYQVSLNPNGGICDKETIFVTYDAPYGSLPLPLKIDYRFQGWMQEASKELVTDKTVYKIPSDTILTAQWELYFEDLGNGTNRRPGEDGKMGTEDDHYFYNGSDKTAGTKDDTVLETGDDGVYGSRDDCYENQNGQNVHCGNDKIFDTRDDYIDNGDGTNNRPGEDGKWDTEDDEKWHNGEDKQPGTEDDKLINPGQDGQYGNKDDYIDNGDGTNNRPGEDGKWDTEDDEKWHNGEDKQPGTEDDKLINPGQDGQYGNKDDYIDNGDGTNNRPGEDGKWDTEDDEKWHNGEDKQPGTEDDKLINPGQDGQYGNKDDYIDNGDGTNNRPGEDGKWDTEDDEKWHNGEDKQPGTEDDKLINPGQGDSGNGSDSNSDNSSGGNSNNGSGGNSNNGSGSSSGSWGGGSGSTQGGPGVYGDAYTDVGKGKSGRWEKFPDGWVFHYVNGGNAKDEWCYLYYGVTGRTDWYRFGQDEYMKTGWHQDPDGFWYFLHNISDGTLGHMKTGWYLDTDGTWYYLNPVSDGHRGAMVTGWQLIDGKWYYFNPVSDGRKGAMYAGQMTPDGYLVGADGARIEK